MLVTSHGALDLTDGPRLYWPCSISVPLPNHSRYADVGFAGMVSYAHVMVHESRALDGVVHARRFHEVATETYRQRISEM
jgi:hypothetical protein